MVPALRSEPSPSVSSMSSIEMPRPPGPVEGQKQSGVQASKTLAGKQHCASAGATPVLCSSLAQAGSSTHPQPGPPPHLSA
jgi:hypothetical protein